MNKKVDKNLNKRNDRISKVVHNSIQRLTRKKEYFGEFCSIEDWVVRGKEDDVDVENRYLAHIKQYIMKKYQSKDIYISPSAVDDIIFYCIKNCDSEVFIENVDKFITKSGLNRNSIVIVPLHSFGFNYLGTRHLSRNSLNIFFENSNFRVYPQTNSYEKTINIIKQYMEDVNLANRRKLTDDLFKHYYESRNLQWMERNPFMIMHFKFSQQEKFDNIKFILEKIEFITNKLYFIYALSNGGDTLKLGSLFSTRVTNNWETLDIKHFMTISTKKGGADLNCLPVYFSNLWVFDIIHMNIDLNHKVTSGKKWFKKSIDAVDKIYFGYLQYRLYGETKYLKYYRLTNSLKYFRRSIKSLSDEDKIINLNTAFEILLIDDFESQKKNKMLDRLWKLLKRRRQERKKDINLKLGDMIDERNNLIHGGVLKGIQLDYTYLNYLYCRFVLNIVNDIEAVDSSKNKYLSKYYDCL